MASDLLSIRNVLSGRNLLYNWDFRNPVNQRGLADYTATGYTIDRWRSFLIGDGISVSDAGITLKAGAKECSSRQVIEFPQRYAGKTLTFSFKPASTGSLTIVWFTTIAVYTIDTFNNVEPGKIYTVTKTMPVDLPYLAVQFVAQIGSVTIESAKLEIGAVSTLANDPPQDYGAELAKCQRYQTIIEPNARFRSNYIDVNSLYFNIEVPVALRINPTIDFSSFVVSQTGAGEASGFAFSNSLISPNIIRVVAQKNAHGLTDGLLRVASRTIIDAEIY